MLGIHPNHTVMKIILRAHNKTLLHSNSRLNFKSARLEISGLIIYIVFGESWTTTSTFHLKIRESHPGLVHMGNDSESFSKNQFLIWWYYGTSLKKLAFFFSDYITRVRTTVLSWLRNEVNEDVTGDWLTSLWQTPTLQLRSL